MVRRSEAILGLRPMRRIALLRGRLEAVEKNQVDLNDVYEKAKQALEQERHTLDEVSQQVTILETQVREAETSIEQHGLQPLPQRVLFQSNQRLACKRT